MTHWVVSEQRPKHRVSLCHHGPSSSKLLQGFCQCMSCVRECVVYRKAERRRVCDVEHEYRRIVTAVDVALQGCNVRVHQVAVLPDNHIISGVVALLLNERCVIVQAST